jgi:DNA mismatch repair ATPase MutL
MARVVITSRYKTSAQTFQKVLENGKTCSFGQCDNRSGMVRAWYNFLRNPLVGTTVCVTNLFVNFPVRRMALKKSGERQKVKRFVEYMALGNPGVSFSVFETNRGAQLILTQKVCLKLL